MARDPREDHVTRQKNGVSIEGTLRDMRVGNGHRYTLARQLSAKIAHANPVVERRLMYRRVLKQLADHATLARARSADKLRHHDGRDDCRSGGKGFRQFLCRLSSKEIDPD